MFGFALVLLVIGTNYAFISANMFTSVDTLRIAIHGQVKIIDELKSHVAKEKDRLSEIKNVVDRIRLESSSQIGADELENLISNPIGAYLMVKKYHKNNLNFENIFDNQRDLNETLKRIEEFLVVLPAEEDLESSTFGLVRLQETYKLPISVFVDGFRRPSDNNKNDQSGKVMDAHDCFTIGRIAFERGYHAASSLWLTEAYQMAEKEPKSTVNKTLLLEYLSFANYRIGKISLALEQAEELLTLAPNHPYAAANVKGFKTMLVENGGESEHVKSQFEELTEIFNKLCRGEKTVPIKNAYKLTCDYARNNDPRLLIAPLKRETIHLDPWIVIYHNVMTDAEIDNFKQNSVNKLEPAKSFDQLTGKDETSFYRVGRIGWLDSNDTDRLVPRLRSRVSAMTQLTLEYADKYQIAHYGISGYYREHFDFSDDDKVETTFGDEDDRGNRIASLIFYMSDVEAGGATVFTDLGLTVYPEKGAALFYHNLYKSGKGDRVIIHGACPVLSGSKWTANKWFHYGSNQFWHPCSRDEFDRFKIEDMENTQPTYHRANGRFEKI